jgi:hypothetical protein
MMQIHHDEGRIDIAFPPERVPELIEVTARLNPDVSDFLAWQSFSAMRLKAIRGRDEALFGCLQALLGGDEHHRPASFP